jgi:hypothetical protein
MPSRVKRRNSLLLRGLLLESARFYLHEGLGGVAALFLQTVGVSLLRQVFLPADYAIFCVQRPSPESRLNSRSRNVDQKQIQPRFSWRRLPTGSDE